MDGDAMRRCSIPGCQNTIRGGGRGWCKMHWTRWSRTGDPLLTRYDLPKTKRPCTEPYCDRSEYSLELCRSHYELFRAHEYDKPVVQCGDCGETLGEIPNLRKPDPWELIYKHKPNCPRRKAMK